MVSVGFLHYHHHHVLTVQPSSFPPPKPTPSSPPPPILKRNYHEAPINTFKNITSFFLMSRPLILTHSLLRRSLIFRPSFRSFLHLLIVTVIDRLEYSHSFSVLPLSVVLFTKVILFFTRNHCIGTQQLLNGDVLRNSYINWLDLNFNLQCSAAASK